MTPGPQLLDNGGKLICQKGNLPDLPGTPNPKKRQDYHRTLSSCSRSSLTRKSSAWCWNTLFFMLGPKETRVCLLLLMKFKHFWVLCLCLDTVQHHGITFTGPMTPTSRTTPSLLQWRGTASLKSWSTYTSVTMQSWMQDLTPRQFAEPEIYDVLQLLEDPESEHWWVHGTLLRHLAQSRYFLDTSYPLVYFRIFRLKDMSETYVWEFLSSVTRCL